MKSRKVRVRSVRSLSQFLRAVDQVSQQWGAATEGWIHPWFRGQHRFGYGLKPGLYRSANRTADTPSQDDATFRDQFQKLSLPYLDPQQLPRGEWQWYFTMQHHGVPTRLLDWTESAVNAMWFATADRPSSTRTDAAVWVLNPWRFAQVATESGDILAAGQSDDDPAIEAYLADPDGGTQLPADPAPVRPAAPTRRIAAQQGTFTIHGSNQRGLESHPRAHEFLVKFRVPAVRIERIRQEVEIAGAREMILFPDLDHLARQLKRDRGLDTS